MGDYISREDDAAKAAILDYLAPDGSNGDDGSGLSWFELPGQYKLYCAIHPSDLHEVAVANVEQLVASRSGTPVNFVLDKAHPIVSRANADTLARLLGCSVESAGVLRAVADGDIDESDPRVGRAVDDCANDDDLRAFAEGIVAEFVTEESALYECYGISVGTANGYYVLSVDRR